MKLWTQSLPMSTGQSWTLVTLQSSLVNQLRLLSPCGRVTDTDPPASYLLSVRHSPRSRAAPRSMSPRVPCPTCPHAPWLERSFPLSSWHRIEPQRQSARESPPRLQRNAQPRWCAADSLYLECAQGSGAAGGAASYRSSAGSEASRGWNKSMLFYTILGQLLIHLTCCQRSEVNRLILLLKHV